MSPFPPDNPNIGSISRLQKFLQPEFVKDLAPRLRRVNIPREHPRASPPVAARRLEAQDELCDGAVFESQRDPRGIRDLFNSHHDCSSVSMRRVAKSDTHERPDRRREMSADAAQPPRGAFKLMEFKCHTKVNTERDNTRAPIDAPSRILAPIEAERRVREWRTLRDEVEQHGTPCPSAVDWDFPQESHCRIQLATHAPISNDCDDHHLRHFGFNHE